MQTMFPEDFPFSQTEILSVNQLSVKYKSQLWQVEILSVRKNAETSNNMLNYGIDLIYGYEIVTWISSKKHNFFTTLIFTSVYQRMSISAVN